MKKYGIIVIALLFGFFVQAQNDNVPKNLSKYDYKRLRFGYTLGYTTMDFSFKYSEEFATRDITTDTVFGIENARLPGFHLGIVSEFHPVNYLDIRFLPGLSFGERKLSYLQYNHKKSKYEVHYMQIESTFLDFPLLLKYYRYPVS